MRICHITTVHNRYDVRIFHKMCKSLSEKYSDVILIVADGKGYEKTDGVEIRDIGTDSGRLNRFFKTVNRAKKEAVKINADVYHLHDPELLRISGKLIRLKKKVLYDAHEDVPRQILSKYYIPKYIRKIVSKIVEVYENKKGKKLSGIIAATPHIKERFLNTNINTVDVNNFPEIKVIPFYSDWTIKEKAIVYIGGIFKTRGIIEMLDAIEKTDITLHLAGVFSPKELEQECREHPAWENVIYYGFVERPKINEIFEKGSLGVVLLESTPSYIVSMPVKMFEYMAAGLPVIASDFPLWKEIIESNNCGICVDQNDSLLIYDAIKGLVANKDRCRTYGANGREAVEKKYNWNIEKEKLFDVYNKLLEK